jgi:hypothetical protein
VLFFGDSMRSDVSTTKRFANWDTVLVLEEMEAEDENVLEEIALLNNGKLSEPALKKQRVSVS